MVLGNILGAFFLKASGHPGGCVGVSETTSAIKRNVSSLETFFHGGDKRESEILAIR
jgi:hypothetical protein